jgi:tetratricopeptide (TPR) repeat protein
MLRIAALSLLALSLALPATGHAQDATQIPELMKQGDSAYRKRYSEKVAWEAIYFYREVLKLDANNFEANWKLARSFYSLSDTIASTKRKKELGAEGVKYGEAAAKLQPGRVEGWFYGVICLGEYSMGIGLLTALKQGIEGKFRSMLDKAMAINPGFDYAGPPRAYGRFYFKLPWPKRDYKKAEQYLLDSRRRSPTKVRSYFYLAELYEADGRKADALAQLRECVSLDPRKEDHPDGARYLKDCKALLAKLESK